MNDPGQDPGAYQHIHSVLARRIRDGEYPAGAKLPTETELADEFGCGPDAAARALRALQRDGLARGYSEKGTYCLGPMFIKASHDAPARLPRPAAFCISALPPYSPVDRNHQQDVGSRTSASAEDRADPLGHVVRRGSSKRKYRLHMKSGGAWGARAATTPCPARVTDSRDLTAWPRSCCWDRVWFSWGIPGLARRSGRRDLMARILPVLSGWPDRRR
jgi:Bacterial regulatory proteins, gntR family